MSALVRGSCPACGRDVALRKGGLVREHQDQIYGGAWGTCAGSGKPNGCNPETRERQSQAALVRIERERVARKTAAAG